MSYLGSRVLTLFAVVCLGSMPVSVVASQKFQFAYEDKENYPAFTGNGADIPDNPGTYVEILREVTRRLDMELELIRVPWQRALIGLERGTVDGINGSFKPERESFARYPRLPDGSLDTSRYITKDAYSLYVPYGSTLRWHADQGMVGLPGQRPSVVAPSGYSIVDVLQARGIDVLTTDGGLESLTQMLLTGRADGLVAHQRPMSFMLRNRPDLSAALETVLPPIDKKYYFIMLSDSFVEANPELAERFWSTLADVRDEMLDELYREYEQRR